MRLSGTYDSMSRGMARAISGNVHIVFVDVGLAFERALKLFDFLPLEHFRFYPIFLIKENCRMRDFLIYSGMDYLMKPISSPVVVAKLMDVRKSWSKKLVASTITRLHHNYYLKEIPVLGIREEGKFLECYPHKEIICIIAIGENTRIHYHNSTFKFLYRPLRVFRSVLTEDHGFFSPHPSYLINLHFVRDFLKTEGGLIIMSNKIEVPLAPKSRARFNRIVEKWNS
ncbi:MAG: LytTR family transcriptional regulator DNA-binding domain-containing protein [Bacteroidia bacterium]|nr:LytTR family transcriptional regulator DNA-binding domain-containing protein [Bacteroidia bacterium]